MYFINYYQEVLSSPWKRVILQYYTYSNVSTLLTQPLTRRRVCPPTPVLGGGAHSLAREGLGESQFRRGDIHSDTLYIYVLCGCTVTLEDAVISLLVKTYQFFLAA
jgi:hypothetical protein